MIQITSNAKIWNKKFYLTFLLFFLFSITVFAGDFGVIRKIDGDKITLMVSPGDYDMFTLTEEIEGASVVLNSWKGDCGLINKKLTCDFKGNVDGKISYRIEGVGKINGKMYGSDMDVRDANNNFIKKMKNISGESEVFLSLSMLDFNQDLKIDNLDVPGLKQKLLTIIGNKFSENNLLKVNYWLRLFHENYGKSLKKKAMQK